MDRRERGSTIEVEDDVRVAHYVRMARNDFVVRAQRADAAEVGNHRIDQGVGTLRERTILAREVELCLNASTSGRRVGGGQHVRKTQTRKADVLVVDVCDLSVRQIRPVDTDVDENAGRARESLRRIDDVSRRARDHRHEVR